MNRDVKNNLEKLLSACESVQAGMLSTGGNRDISRLVVQDILSFIGYISTEGAEDRMIRFKEDYLDLALRDIPVTDAGKGVPASFELLCQLDTSVLANRNIRISALYMAVMVALGKYYSWEQHDTYQTDLKKLNDYIARLKDYASKRNLVIDDGNISRLEKVGQEPSFPVPTDSPTEENEPEETLEQLLEQLNNMIGLEQVKQEVKTLVNLLKIKAIRESRGYKTVDVSKHLVFVGNPGTGKTTVARFIAKIYKQMGILEKGQLVEVDRGGLVAGYIGHTAIQTKEKIDEAMGGILFIDEAYTLAKKNNSSDFGQEAVDTILKEMEDKRDKFVVIAAGYPKEMDDFLNSNPGLKSRFSKSILFEDYSEDELFKIFEQLCESNDMKLSSTAKPYLKTYLEHLLANKPENFGNGREMRNLFEKVVSNQANRLAQDGDISDEELTEIIPEDFGL